MYAALEGPKQVEKLPDFANKYIVVVQEDGKNLTEAQIAASRLDARAAIAQDISTRAKEMFFVDQAGDTDMIGTYLERCMRSVSEATFGGFSIQGDWWVKIRTFTPDGKPDKQVYRIIQVWGIDKDALQRQIDKILDDEAVKEPKTPETQKLVDQLQQFFHEVF
jgi:hypothetical protein